MIICEYMKGDPSTRAIYLRRITCQGADSEFKRLYFESNKKSNYFSHGLLLKAINKLDFTQSIF